MYGGANTNGEVRASAGNNASYILACWNGEGYVINPAIGFDDKWRVATLLTQLPSRHFTKQNARACRAVVVKLFGAEHADNTTWPAGFEEPGDWSLPLLCPDGAEPPVFHPLSELVHYRNTVDSLRQQANSDLLTAVVCFSRWVNAAEREHALTGLPYGNAHIGGRDEVAPTVAHTVLDALALLPLPETHRDRLLALLRLLEETRNVPLETRLYESADTADSRLDAPLPSPRIYSSTSRHSLRDEPSGAGPSK